MTMPVYLFDLDGTLFDSMDTWTKIDHEFLGKRGIVVPPDYIEAISHLPYREVAEYTIRRFGLTEPAESIMQEWHSMAVEAYSTAILPKPYALEYLGQLRSLGCRLAVVTSLSDPLRVPLLERYGLTDYFEAVYTTEQVGKGKQYPDIYLHAARMMQVDPSSCIVFEDILPAVLSAKAAGMTVYAMRDPASNAQWDEIAASADGTLEDFRDAPLPGAMQPR